MKDFILGFIGLCSIVGLFIVGIIVVLQLILLTFHRVPVKVFVDGKEVYHGINACVEIDSAGASTIVKVDGGPLCLFPMARYVSKDVHVEGDRR